MDNLQIAKILFEIAEMLQMQNVAFKPRAYEKAAMTIESLSESVVQIAKRGELEKLPGIGKSIAMSIDEMVKTGKLKYYTKLKKQLPMDVDDLMAVSGMGPKRIILLYKKLKIKTLKDLEKAAKAGKIQEIKGLGQQVEEDILKGIKIAKQKGKRMLLGYVSVLVQDLLGRFDELKSVNKIEVAGSYRRKKETIGDIDILVTSNKPKEVMDFVAGMKDVADVIASGRTKTSVRLQNGAQVDVRVLKDSEFGSALQYFTGNKAHNVEVRKLALSKGYTLNEYGLYTRKTKKWVAGKTEKQIYAKLGLAWIPPELRQGKNEIALAKAKKIPNLIEYGDAKGDFQTQTNWSDGEHSIEEMAKAAIKLGWKFMVVTDHVGNVAVANPLDEKRLLKQWKEIDKLNKKLGIRILKGAEVDILKNGKLALSRKMQDKLDVVLGAVHLSVKMSEKEMTKRICTALENDRVHVMAHPTGRLVQQRNPYNINVEKMFEVAKANDVFVELNGAPERMDLHSDHARRAKEMGCKFVLSTDAHSVSGLPHLRLAEAIARRAGLESKDILNTKSVKQIEKILGKK